MVTVADTIELIKVLHDGQFDWTGVPYWHHPLAVMNLLPSNSPLDRQLMALFHDTVEDCRANIARLMGLEAIEATSNEAYEFLASKGYNAHVLDGVRHLTRDKIGVTYMDEIRNIVASGDVDIMWVKLCDNTHNTDPGRIERLSSEDRAKVIEMGKRYERSKAILRAGILTTIPSSTVQITYRENGLPGEMRLRFTGLERQASDWMLLAEDEQNTPFTLVYSSIVRLTSG